jgi:hypothetical protein
MKKHNFNSYETFSVLKMTRIELKLLLFRLDSANKLFLLHFYFFNKFFCYILSFFIKMLRFIEI